MILHGSRKFILGMTYLIGCFAISTAAVLKGLTGWDAAGVAALFVSVATGLGVVVNGNVQEHRAKAGAGQG